MQKMFEHRVITHIHTDASSGEASLLDPLISTGIKNVLGEDVEIEWKECFNKPSELANLLKPESGISIVFITDHMNHKRHLLNTEAVEIASKEPRFAVGAEIQTVMLSEDGHVLQAPEVLVYGREEEAEFAKKKYCGISQEDLDILFNECAIDREGRVDTISVRDYLLLRGYAHVLAHPFDGSHLGLEELLDLITEFRFVETVNGGFPEDTSTRLSLFISWYNFASRGLLHPRNFNSPILKKLCIKALRTGPIHPWGGSDAHASHKDRVTIIYKTDKKYPHAKDFIKDMVNLKVSELLLKKYFKIEGAPATKLSLLDDVIRIAYRNLLENIDVIRRKGKLIEILSGVQRLATMELMSRRKARKKLIREFDTKIGEEIKQSLAKLNRSRFPRPLKIFSRLEN